jgi:hypothetical protein
MARAASTGERRQDLRWGVVRERRMSTLHHTSIGPEDSTCQARNPESGFLACRLLSGAGKRCCWAISLLATTAVVVLRFDECFMHRRNEVWDAQPNLLGHLRLEFDQVDVSAWEFLTDEADVRTVVLLLNDSVE